MKMYQCEIWMFTGMNMMEAPVYNLYYTSILFKLKETWVEWNLFNIIDICGLENEFNFISFLFNRH